VRWWPFFLIITALAGQTQPAEVAAREEKPAFQSNVNLVRVPAVVRDKQGHAIGGFQKQDFQLTDQGRPQEIAQFAIEGGAVPKPAGQQTKSETPDAPAAAGSTPAAAASTPAARARFVACVFDDLYLTTEELLKARKAALKHIEPGIAPQERIALFTLSGNVSLEFTDDVAKFREKLTKVKSIPPQPHQPQASFYLADQFVNLHDKEALAAQVDVTMQYLQLPPELRGQAVATAEDTLREVAIEGWAKATNSLRTLNDIIRSLAAMPGDRIVILASPGMYLPGDLQKGLSATLDRATRSGVVINTLDVRGVYTNEPNRIDLRSTAQGGEQTQMRMARYESTAGMAQGMVLSDLAHSTGGTAVDDNDLLGGFNRLANAPEYVYYLGYYPQDLKPDGRFHEIKVTLANGNGLSIQARRGYWAPPDAPKP
jgi:VWFA-related protein